MEEILIIHCQKCGSVIPADRVRDFQVKGKLPKNCKPCNDRIIRNWRNNMRRRDRDEVYRSLGMTKVRGNLGGIYYE